MEQVWSQTYKTKDHLEQVSSLLTVMPRRRCPELIGCELPPACAELGGRPETVSLIHCHSPSSVMPACLPPLFTVSLGGPHLICSCVSHLHAPISISSDSSTASGLCGLLGEENRKQKPANTFPTSKALISLRLPC